MALEAGELTLVLEYAHNLRDVEWFGRQDPACVITCGSQKVRSKTHTDGGKNPVWNQTFKFNVINENDITLTVVEDDIIGKDDLIGTGTVPLAKARNQGHDRQQVLLYCKKGRQAGTVQVSLTFTRNSALAYGAPYGAPPPSYAGYYAPQMPTAPYGAYPAGPPPPAYYQPYSAPPPQAYHQSFMQPGAPAPYGSPYAQPGPQSAYSYAAPPPQFAPQPYMTYPPPQAPGVSGAYPSVPYRSVAGSS